MGVDKQKGKATMPSKQWSCSELVDGTRELMAVKAETAGLDKLGRRDSGILPWILLCWKFTIKLDDLMSFYKCMLKTFFNQQRYNNGFKNQLYTHVCWHILVECLATQSKNQFHSRSTNGRLQNWRRPKLLRRFRSLAPLKVFLDLYDFPTDGQNINLENHHELWLTDRRNNFIRSLGSWDPSCFLAKHRMICLDVAFYFIFFWVNFYSGSPLLGNCRRASTSSAW